MDRLIELVLFAHNEKSSILLIFFFHAILFSFLILKNGSDENRRANNWLAAFLFLGALYISLFMLGYAGWYSRNPYREFMFFMPLQQLFLIGPVFFFYVKTLLNREISYERKDALHFVPALLYLIYSLIVFITDKFVLDEFYFYADGEDKDLDKWYQIAGVVSMLFYLYLSLRYYLNYRKISLQEVSFADEIAYVWIKNFAIAFSLILILRIVFFFTNPEWWNFGEKYWYYLVFSILLLYISISGYSNTIRVAIKFNFVQLNETDQLGTENEETEVSDLNSDASSREWSEKITNLFEKEQVYKDANLTLTDLASQLNSNRSVISKAINQEFSMNFNDFVNEKRAEAVMEKLDNGEHVKSTLLGIALDCGFNSKTTFNRAFKKHTGLTPQQFIKKDL